MGKNSDTNQQEKSASLDNIDVNDAQIDKPKQSDDLSKEKTQKNTKKKPNKRKLTNIIIAIIVPIILTASLLIFAYQNNLIGFKDFVGNIQEQSFFRKDKAPKKEILNATQQIAKEKEKNILNNSTLKAVNQAQDEAEKTLDNQNKNSAPLSVQNPKINIEPKEAKTSNRSQLQKQDAVSQTVKTLNTKNVDQDFEKNNNQKFIRAKQVSSTFFNLINKVNEGSSYLNILIDLKTNLKNTHVEIPTLTEYASAGFPTNTIIISGALKVLKKLVVLQSRQEAKNIFDKILNKFIIVTPTSKINGFSGILFDIKKALQNNDFDAALEQIDELTAQQQKSFNDLKLILKDKKNIQHELKLFNDALMSDIFI